MDYYELLGVDEEASQMYIKKAYFAKIKQYAPEKYPEKFIEGGYMMIIVDIDKLRKFIYYYGIDKFPSKKILAYCLIV